MSTPMKNPPSVNTSLDPGLEYLNQREIEIAITPVENTTKDFVFEEVTQIITNVFQVNGPSGANGQLQFNQNGQYIGDAELQYDPNTDTLTTGKIVANSITITGNVNNFKLAGGYNNEVLKTDGNGNLSWANVFPSVSGKSGKFLVTNGVSIDWSNGNYNSFATTSYVDSAIATLVGTSPAMLDTLAEIANVIGQTNDPQYGIISQLANKANISNLAQVAFSGSYADLSNIPNISTVSNTGNYSDLNGIPTIPTTINDLGISDGTVGQVLTTRGNGTYHFTTVTSGSNANIGNIKFDNNIIYSNTGVVINNSDLTNGQTAGMAIPAQGDGNTSALYNTYGNVTILAGNIGNSQPVQAWTFNPAGALFFPQTPYVTSAILVNDNNQELSISTDRGSVSIWPENSKWLFGADGNLTIPAGGDILDSTGNSVLGGGFSGNYSDLSNKPNLLVYATAANLSTLSNSVANITWANLSGAPTIPTDVSDLTDTTNLLGGGSASTGNITFSGDNISGSDNAVRIRSLNTTTTASYSFNPSNSDYSTAVWDGTDITFNDPTQAIYDAIWALTNLSTIQVQVAGTWFTVTSSGSSTPGMPQAPTLFVNELAVGGPLNIDVIDIDIIQGTESYVEIDGSDFRVDVQDDIRIYGNDTFLLYNKSTTDPIRIETNDGSHQWSFNSDGDLILPDGGDIKNDNGNSLLFSGAYADLTDKPTIPTSFSSLVNDTKTVSLGTDGVLTLPEGSAINDAIEVVAVTLDQFTDGGFTGTQVFTKVSDILYQVLPSGPTMELVSGVWRLKIGVAAYYYSTDLITWGTIAGGLPTPVGTLGILETINLTAGVDIAQVGSTMTIATDSEEGTGAGTPGVVDVPFDGTLYNAYPAGSTITFANGDVRTITSIIQGSVGAYQDISYSGSATTSSPEFPIILKTANYAAAIPAPEWTFNNTGNLTLPKGTIVSETANTTVITPPGALAGQSLVIRLTGATGIISDHPGGFSDGDTITLTVTPDYNYAQVTGTVDYTFTGCTSVELGRALTGTLTFTTDTSMPISWTIPVSSTIEDFTITLSNASGFSISGIAPLTLTKTGSSEDHHIHLIAGDPSITDIYLGDDDQYVKIEKNGGNVVIGTDTNSRRWTFDNNGNLTVPANSSILTNETALKIATHSTTTYTFNQAYWEALNGDSTRMFTLTGDAQYFSCTVTANQDGTYTVADPTGNSFAPGNWFKVPGNELGGTTPANDIQINIATVDGEGVILTTTTTGTAVGKQWQFGADGSLTFPDNTVQTTASIQGEHVFTLNTGAITYAPTAVDFNLLFVTAAVGYSATNPTSVTLPNGVPGQRLVIFNGYNLATLTVNPGPVGRDISSGVVAEFIYSGFDGLWMPLYGTNSPT